MEAVDLLIAAIETLITLQPEDEARVRSAVRVKKLSKKQVLHYAGEVCTHHSFVVKGCLITYFANDHTEHLLQIATEGWWVSDIASFISGRPGKLNIEAIEDTTVMQIDKPQFEILLEKIPALEKYFRIKLFHALVAQQERSLSYISDTAEERYKILIKKYPTLEQRISQARIASYIGVTPQFLSRMKSKARKLK